jgi:hypothetical protein
MTSTAKVGFFNAPSPLGALVRRRTRQPRRPGTILSRIGAIIFAAGDTEATWWNWEIHERHWGLGRRYRDRRFLLRTAIPAQRRELGGE